MSGSRGDDSATRKYIRSQFCRATREWRSGWGWIDNDPKQPGVHYFVELRSLCGGAYETLDSCIIWSPLQTIDPPPQRGVCERCRRIGVGYLTPHVPQDP